MKPGRLLSLWCACWAGIAAAGEATPSAGDIRLLLDADDQLQGGVELGYVALPGGARLPVRLEHTVRRSVSGERSFFSVTPVETFLVSSPEEEPVLLWRSPLGGLIALPRSPLGAYAVPGLSYHFAADTCTLQLGDGARLVYREGLLRKLILRDGIVLRCDTRGAALLSVRSDGDLLLTSTVDQEGLTVCGRDESGRPITFRVWFNRRGQAVAFASPAGRGTIDYDERGFLSSIRSPYATVRVSVAPVPFWDYRKRQRGIERTWRLLPSGPPGDSAAAPDKPSA